MHPLCACVVAAAVEELDYTLADEVLYRGLAALNSKVVFISPAFGFPCLFQSPVGELLSLLRCLLVVRAGRGRFDFRAKRWNCRAGATSPVGQVSTGPPFPPSALTRDVGGSKLLS